MQAIKNAAEKYRQLIYDTQEFILQHPETGYKEIETSKYLENIFRTLGYDVVCAKDITGFYTRIETGRPGPEVMILAELDSIICPSHPNADPITGAAHACGHNAQCAAMVGIAAALTEPNVLEGLSGNIRLCLVPAEELLEIEYRTKLKEENKIKYMGGKSEFLSRGYFDGVDIAFMIHTSDSTRVMEGSVGCMAKSIIYKGRSSHAGGSPWNGINALYAANCGLNAINAIRETFKEADIIRVHPIITKGGDMVNAIPEEVRMESYVRGNTFEGIVEANNKVNQALIGAAISIGANIEIIDIPGYAPLHNDSGLRELMKEAADAIIPEHGCFLPKTFGSGSTDMGDLSCIMPVVHPHCNGAAGQAHGNNYQIADVEKACVDSAKWQVAALRLLLQDDAFRAKKIVADYKPLFASKDEYLSFMNSLNCSGNRIVYQGDGTATIKLW